MMRNLSIARIAVLGTLSFFVGLESPRPVQAHDADPCDGLRPVPLFFEGEPADEFAERIRGIEDELDREEELNSLVLDPLGLTDQQKGQLPELLRRFDQEIQAIDADDVPEALRGIAGFSTMLLLGKLIEDAGAPIVDKVVYGKIRDYVYHAADGGGHLAVDVCLDRKEFVPVNADEREYFHWDVEISDDQFSVAERADLLNPPPFDISDPDDYPDQPFIDTASGQPIDLTLPAAATDPADPMSVWRRGLDHKLSASGTGIVVRHVYYRKLSTPDLIRLPDSHPFYMSTDASCVDLFTQGPPPATFSELVDAGYCLGRCAHPAIYNSGD